MIPISIIDNELSIFKENKVVIWGTGKFSHEITKLLTDFSVEIYAYCDNDPEKWGKSHYEKPIISPDELKKLCETSSVVVQSGVSSLYESEVMKKATLLGVKEMISFNESKVILTHLKKLEIGKTYPDIVFQPSSEKREEIHIRKHKNIFLKYLLFGNQNPTVFVCGQAKVANSSLGKTLRENNTKSLGTHFPEFISHKVKETDGQAIKILTGTREPIGRYISLLFQQISSIDGHFFGMDQEFSTDVFEKKLHDAQFYFDYITSEKYFQNTPYEKSFFERFSKAIFDPLAHSFDPEKGYTLIKEGNVEVFVYQLEKLNNLLEPISAFVGQPIDKWHSANEASEKWVKPYYEQAKKELRFSQEFFDSCYNDPYIQHFYSPADIEKFKEKWKNNILK